MRCVEFTVPGVPIAQPRVKATTRGKHAGVYTPTKTSTGKSNGVAEFKALVKLVASQAFDGSPMAGPLRVDLICVFPRHSNKFWKSKPMPRYRHVQKPDSDNLMKSIYDTLTGVIWVDDCQVCSGSTNKWHAAGGEQPHVVIMVREIAEVG